MDNEQVLQLDPATVLADDNSRFNLKPVRLAQLRDSIKEQGGVNTPVEVALLDKPQGKVKYRLTAGFYRHQAVTDLNKDENAGLTLPALVRQPADDKDRLNRQLSENMDRENQSPMDKAVAIKKLMDAGVSKLDIRRIFSTPGGKKGLTLQPASNSFINMMVSFLTLPKAIQEKVHDGRVGVAAAYELTKVAPDKRAAILERAEADRIKDMEREEREEERYLRTEQKAAEAVEKAAEAATAVETARVEVTNSASLIEEKTLALREIQKVPYLELDDAGKKEVTEKLKAAEADVKGAQKTKKDAENRLAKALTATKSADEQAADKAAKLDTAKKAKAKAAKGKGVKASDVQKAAKAEGASSKFVALNASQMKDALKDILKSSSQPARVKAIADVVARCFSGELTPLQMGHDLGVITGEVKK